MSNSSGQKIGEGTTMTDGSGSNVGNGTGLLEEESDKSTDEKSLEEMLNSKHDSRLCQTIIGEPTLIIAGSRGAGKDTILTRLSRLTHEPDAVEYGQYRKVPYCTLSRRAPRGLEREELERGVVKYKTFEELSKDDQKYVFWYTTSDGKFYGFQPADFDVVGMPVAKIINMVHIRDVNGLNALKKAKRFSHPIIVFIDADNKKDLRNRAITRLSDELGVSISEVHNQHRVDANNNLKLMRSASHEFRKGGVKYDLVFKNNDPLITDDKVRCALFPNARDDLIDCFAYKLNQYLHLYMDAFYRTQQGQAMPGPPTLHHRFVGNVTDVLFGKRPSTSEISYGTTLAGNVHRVVAEYAESAIEQTPILNAEKLDSYLKAVRVTKCGNNNPGIITIYIKSQSNEQISLESLARKVPNANPDYHVLRLLGYCLFKDARTRVKSEYLADTDKKHIIGLYASLTDARPVGQGAKRYHGVRIIYDYSSPSTSATK